MQLAQEETERLLARMRSKLMRRLEDKKINVQEAVAIQLKIEDRRCRSGARMAEISKKSRNK